MDYQQNQLINKKIELVNIDGLGNFNSSLQGVVISQSDNNKCRVKLNQPILRNKKQFDELNIITRHVGYDFRKLHISGIRKLLNFPHIIAVNVFDDTNEIRFIAEIMLKNLK